MKYICAAYVCDLYVQQVMFEKYKHVAMALPWHCHGTAMRNELEVLLCICMVPWLRRRSTLGCASLYGNPHKRRTRIHHYPSGIQFFCFFFWGGVLQDTISGIYLISFAETTLGIFRVYPTGWTLVNT